jgi:hypothetical protein
MLQPLVSDTSIKLFDIALIDRFENYTDQLRRGANFPRGGRFRTGAEKRLVMS